MKSKKNRNTISILLCVKMFPYLRRIQSMTATIAMISIEIKSHAQKFNPHFKPIIRSV